MSNKLKFVTEMSFYAAFKDDKTAPDDMAFPLLFDAIVFRVKDNYFPCEFNIIGYRVLEKKIINNCTRYHILLETGVPEEKFGDVLSDRFEDRYTNLGFTKDDINVNLLSKTSKFDILCCMKDESLDGFRKNIKLYNFLYYHAFLQDINNKIYLPC